MGFLSKKTAFSEHIIKKAHMEICDNQLDISDVYPRHPIISGL